MQNAIIDNANETPKRYQCRHIFTDGHRCGSACLRNEEFCYYHHTTRMPAANPRTRRGRRSTFALPLPEDRSAIQASIGEVLQRIAANDIDPRRAGLLLYGLQIASLNLPKPQVATRHQRSSSPAAEVVEEIYTHPDLGILAPKAEVNQTGRPESLIPMLIRHLNELPPKAAQPIPEPSQPEPQTQTTILPELNAEATNAIRRPSSRPRTTCPSRNPTHRLTHRAARQKKEAGTRVTGLLPQLLRCSNGKLETELPLGHPGDTDQTSTQKQEGCRLRNWRCWRKSGNRPSTSILNRDKSWSDCSRICLHDQEVTVVPRRNVRCSKEVEVDHAAIRRASDHVRRLGARE
jgi:hypothetical protein